MNNQDLIMSETNDLPEVGCRLRYLICCSPRTGSTLVTQSLKATGKAGVPEEYFDPRSMKAYFRRTGQSRVDVGEYLSFLERNRTTTNGLFGVKLHWDLLVRTLGDQARVPKLVRRFDRIILLTRENVVAQAISLLRAAQTNVFNTADREVARNTIDRPAQYDAARIATYVARFVAEQRSWRELTSSLDIPVLELSYEQLIRDYTESMCKIVSHLGIDDLDLTIFDRPKFTQKLAGEQSAEWERSFIEEITGRGARE